MAEVTAGASLGVKLNLAAKKEWGNYDNVNAHHTLSITRNYDECLSDEEILEKGKILHAQVRKFVEQKVAQDFKDAKRAE